MVSTGTVQNNNYGRSAVEFFVAGQQKPQHRVRKFTLDMHFAGGLSEVFAKGDNARLLPTNTMMNTALVLAHDHRDDEPEDYARALTERFLSQCSAVETVTVTITVNEYEPIADDTESNPRNFHAPSHEQQLVVVRAKHDEPAMVSSGIRGLRLFRTSGATFLDFLTDEYTTLPYQHDRTVCVEGNVTWEYNSAKVDYSICRIEARAAMLSAFERHASRSTQNTLYQLCTAVLDACPEVGAVQISDSHIGWTAADLSRFERPDNDAVFVPLINSPCFEDVSVSRLNSVETTHS